MKWNNDWRKKIDSDIYLRLCECRNTKHDMLVMAKACQRENPTVAPIDCVIYIMEWVTDWNNQYELELTVEEFDDYVKEVSNAVP
jgi:hypothetical protein